MESNHLIPTRLDNIRFLLSLDGMETISDHPEHAEVKINASITISLHGGLSQVREACQLITEGQAHEAIRDTLTMIFGTPPGGIQ